MRYDTTLADNNIAEKLVQPIIVINKTVFAHRYTDLLLIVTDGELQVTGHDTLFLVIASCISCKLKNLGCQVLENGRKVDCTRHEHNALIYRWRPRTRCTRTNTLCVVALLQETVNTTNGELKTSLRRARL